MRSSWSSVLCALAFKFPKRSTLELFELAKRYAATIKLWKVDQRPNKRIFFHWIASLVGAHITIYVNSTKRLFFHRNPKPSREGYCRLFCQRSDIRHPAYSLIGSYPAGHERCRRCNAFLVGERWSRRRHHVICAYRQRTAHNWRRRLKRRLEGSGRPKVAPPATAARDVSAQKREATLRFRPGKVERNKTVVDYLAAVGIHDANSLFQGNTNFLVFDCESLLCSFYGANKHRLMHLSENVDLANEHELVLCTVAYRLAQHDREGPALCRLFWRRQNEHPSGCLVRLIHFLNRLSDENYRCQRNGAFANLFRRLETMEGASAGNGPFLAHLHAAKNAVEAYIRTLVCCGYNALFTTP